MAIWGIGEKVDEKRESPVDETVGLLFYYAGRDPVERAVWRASGIDI